MFFPGSPAECSGAPGAFHFVLFSDEGTHLPWHPFYYLKLKLLCTLSSYLSSTSFSGTKMVCESCSNFSFPLSLCQSGFPANTFLFLRVRPPVLSVPSNFIFMASAYLVPGTVCASLSRIFISGPGRLAQLHTRGGLGVERLGGIVGCVGWGWVQKMTKIGSGVGQ